MALVSEETMKYNKEVKTLSTLRGIFKRPRGWTFFVSKTLQLPVLKQAGSQPQ